jgi:NADH dehydrogenase
MSDSITVRQRIVRDISIDSGQPCAEASGRVPVLADRPGRPERIVIVGGGFAGFHAVRTLSRTVNRCRWLRRTGTDQVEIVLISSTDYFLYLPLLPEVAAGILDPRRVAVPLADAGPGSGRC